MELVCFPVSPSIAFLIPNEVEVVIKKRAENGTRTRDPNLGKVVLYQLSYFRISFKKKEVKRRRLELPRRNWHYPLKVARLPSPPPLQQIFTYWKKECPEQDSNLHASRHTHLKRARLPIPPPGQLLIKATLNLSFCSICERKTGLGPATPTLARLCSTNWAISAKLLC